MHANRSRVTRNFSGTFGGLYSGRRLFYSAANRVFGDADRLSLHGNWNMPTVLFVMGWRFFFYANERGEPIHIHCRKAEKECKYWLDREGFAVEEAYSFSMNNK